MAAILDAILNFQGRTRWILGDFQLVILHIFLDLPCKNQLVTRDFDLFGLYELILLGYKYPRFSLQSTSKDLFFFFLNWKVKLQILRALRTHIETFFTLCSHQGKTKCSFSIYLTYIHACFMCLYLAYDYSTLY